MVFLNLSRNLLLLLLEQRSAERRSKNWELSLGFAVSSQSDVDMHLYLSDPQALPFGRRASDPTSQAGRAQRTKNDGNLAALLVRPPRSKAGRDPVKLSGCEPACAPVHVCLGACMPAQSWGRSRDPVDLHSKGAAEPGAGFTKEVSERTISLPHPHQGYVRVRNSNSDKGFVRRISLGES